MLSAEDIEDTFEMVASDSAEDRKRITLLECKIETLIELLNGDLNETTKRAMALKDIVTERGIITRREAQNALGNCHHNVAIRAMEKAAAMYGYVHTKNRSGKWILSAI